ncbi:MAG: hypothetical protein ACLTAN_01335 [Christensenellaceae bacterium]
MIVFSSADGTVRKVLPTHVYQGSSLAGDFYFVAPFPGTNAVTVFFQLANGEFTEEYPLTPMTVNGSELQDMFNSLGSNYGVWDWRVDNGLITAYPGEVTAQFKISYYDDNGEQQEIFSSVVTFYVQESETPLPPETPSGDQWDVLIKLYTELSVELHALSQPKIEPEKGTVPLRDGNGNVKTNEPKEDADTANKKFVEEKISEFKTIISKQLEDKLDKNAIVQETGNAEDKVMSQKSVTEALSQSDLEYATDRDIQNLFY